MPDLNGFRRVFSVSSMPRKLVALADKGGTRGRRIVVSLKSQQAGLYHQAKRFYDAVRLGTPVVVQR